jgi:hypothetical protein
MYDFPLAITAINADLFVGKEKRPKEESALFAILYPLLQQTNETQHHISIPPPDQTRYAVS